MMTKNNFRRKTKRKGKKTYSIIVDGQTEVWYFQMLKKHEKLLRIDIKPELPKKKKLSEQFESVIQNSNSYDKLIWILDFDTIIKESAETKKGEKPAIQLLKEYATKLKEYDNIDILINTPCLEFWLLLHFEDTSKYYSKCESTERKLKITHLKDYEKTEKYFKKRDNDIYIKLKQHQIKAKRNALKLGNFNFKNPQSGKAEIYKVLEILGIKE